MMQNKNLCWLILIATLVRFIIAITIQLGNDEVYYISYAKHLQWNYFDHPPMVALLIRITTFNLYFTSDFFIRLGPILLAAANTWIIYNIVARLKNEAAGLLAALLFTASPYCSIIAGVFILPDAPQLFFYLISIKLLLKIVNDNAPRAKQNNMLLLFGITSGLCVMSKVHGIFLWLGFGAFIILHKRKLLSNIYLYIAALLTCITVLPILIWNMQNNFVTWNFHSNRVVANSGIHLDSLLTELAGGIAYNNPVNYVLIICAIVVLVKRSSIFNTNQSKLLLWQSIPLIAILLMVSLFRNTLPHWSGPAYTSLIIVVSVVLSDSNIRVGFVTKNLKKIAVSSCLLLAILAAAGICVINYYPGTMGKKETGLLGDGDVTLDMYGWKTAAAQFSKLYTQNKKNQVTNTDFIIAGKWFPGSHIDNYIAQPLALNFMALGDTSDIHTYAWLNNYHKQLQAGDDAYFITASNNYQNPYEKYDKLFSTIERRDSIPILRNGKTAKYFFVYLMRGFQKR
jgi:4-amino-4-deoxy-L-arabinose transferase-like glycosyltransferase